MNAPATGRVTRTVAEWIVTAEFEDLGAAAETAVQRSLLDSLGVMAAGSRHPLIPTMLAVLDELAPRAPAAAHVLVGSAERAGLATAVTLNAAAAHVLDFDDTVLPSRAHFSAPLVAALLALAERSRSGVRGREAATAFAVGFEVATRAADAVDHAGHRWHPTAFMGPLGVAAMAARLLGLDAEGAAQALALAANEAAGLRSSFGSEAKALNVGRAGAAGVRAALFAARGLTAGGHPLDPDGGFLDAMAPGAEPDAFLGGLGSRWVIERNGFKPYPCGFVTHAAIDAVLDVRDALGGPPEAVRAIRLRVCPQTAELTGNPSPTSGLEAKFSVHHAVAAALLDGAVTPESFTDERVADRRYRELADTVELHTVEGFRQGQAEVELVAETGTLHATVAHARGTPANPLDDTQLTAKFLALARPVLGPAADEVVRICSSLADRQLTELTRVLAADMDLPAAP